MRRSAWRTIERVSIWVESAAPTGLEYSTLSFADATLQAEEWAKAHCVA
jgi:hypothetical protein